MDDFDIRNASKKLGGLKRSFPGISHFIVGQSDGQFTVYPVVSTRIENPVRQHTIQLKAITTLGDIASEIGREASLHQGDTAKVGSLSLSFPTKTDFFDTLNAASARLKNPSARINKTTETLGRT